MFTPQLTDALPAPAHEWPNEAEGQWLYGDQTLAGARPRLHGGGGEDRAGELLKFLRGVDTVTGRPSRKQAAHLPEVKDQTPLYRSRVSTSITTRLVRAGGGGWRG